jgi:hypothetical protein
MKTSNFSKSTNDAILNQVREGMQVCDNTDNEIGTVRRVFLGAVSDETDDRGGGPATASTPKLREDTLIEYLAKAFVNESLPEVVRERLLRNGFVQIDTHGLFASDRFVVPDQIESVSDECVHLRLAKDELIER